MGYAVWKNLPRVALVAISSLAASICLAETPGVFPDRILVGQSAAFEGPAEALGLGMREGLVAAFNEANQRGGVHGRKIELVTYDDGYEPDRAIENTYKLINEDKVFALIGAVGTPTAKATQPIAKDADIPFIGPFTGAGFLRDPQNSHVINVRGTYDQETEAWIQHLTEDLDSKKIAILYQDDSFGRAGLSGVKKALEKRNMSLVAEGTYIRNTVAVKSALLKIRKAKPDAVVMVGSYKPIAAFVKLAEKVRLNSRFVTISFVGSKALATELGSAGSGVIVTQVVPFYEDKSLPLVNDYHVALNNASPDAEAGFVSLEGYLVGRLLITALEKAGPALTRQKLIDVFQQRKVTLDVGGVLLSYGPEDNQGMDKVYLSVLQKDGSYAYVDNLKDSVHTAELP
ncbi:ABC transporter substrate-binding protein [Granulosicoccus antarcticus]|uniref:Leucine-specific-binding protein n=1 Tax=Granulosicoccus antarcticus IMCC3135 TaxID=1192854 RepID=A0A2Z2P7G8_9GAMM|nr:ABC transporter substrate-binding protein [Granulosicoccus antarcticus]ASJ76637.1 Leucine-specific-binding protein [Granulosicoccus antarcticus IMCC3135]